jgi:hypothetical protein
MLPTEGKELVAHIVDVQFNWYTKRALLAGAYASTGKCLRCDNGLHASFSCRVELYMLQDRSTDRAATWEFLARRIEGAASLGQAAHKTMEDVRKQPFLRYFSIVSESDVCLVVLQLETGVGMLGNSVISALRSLRAPR